MKKLEGFTLIELLIVVAIIAILAAIAVPNFLEAQTRAKVSRTKADMRTIALAEEAYRVDNTKYFSNYYGLHQPDRPGNVSWWFSLKDRDGKELGSGWPLTTPVSYLASYPMDVFWTKANTIQWGYISSSCMYWIDALAPTDLVLQNPPVIYKDCGYLFMSPGPNLLLTSQDGWGLYDPTNGTISNGDIWYIGKYSFSK